ncbi:MAG: M20 family metallopeptidase [Bacteroidota bacterium]
MSMSVKDQIETLLSDQLLSELTGIRRRLHQHPELSFEEHQTSAYIRKILDDWGIDYSFPFVKTGILARIRGDKPGKRIALRADMDALPVTEETGLEYTSQNPGIMHACGHDIHMTSLLGAIRILDQLKHLIEGEVLFVFQPGEEKIPGGARLMLEEGVFKEYPPDLIIAQHVLPDMESGRVGFKAGKYMASSDEIYITMRGKGGHGALPRHINDPVLMAAHVLITLQQEINRKSPSNIPTVLSFGKVVANGAVNVIPNQVELEGTFRTMNEPWRKEAHQLIEQVTSGIASSMGGNCEVEIRKGYPVLHNHEKITLESKSKAVELLGPDQVEDLEIRMTAEDFAWFAQSIPALMYRLGIKEKGSDRVFPLHTSGFRVDESALKTGISLLSYLSIELLKSTPV